MSFGGHRALPAGPDSRNPRPSDDDMPVVAATVGLKPGGAPSRFVVAYDDVASVRYYGTAFKGWWTTVWPTIEDAIVNATDPVELAHIDSTAKALATELIGELEAVGGPEYAQIGVLAYRQTLAATKLTVNNITAKMPKMVNFLKEISTNGDMQTMDVVFPASPMLLHTNPALLQLLLIPVLNFANNGTGTPFTNPFVSVQSLFLVCLSLCFHGSAFRFC